MMRANQGRGDVEFSVRVNPRLCEFRIIVDVFGRILVAWGVSMIQYQTKNTNF